MKITSVHLHHRRWNVAAEESEELKTVTYATPPMGERRQKIKEETENTLPCPTERFAPLVFDPYCLRATCVLHPAGSWLVPKSLEHNYLYTLITGVCINTQLCVPTWCNKRSGVTHQFELPLQVGRIWWNPTALFWRKHVPPQGGQHPSNRQNSTMVCRRRWCGMIRNKV